MEISVYIITFNESDKIRDCINSVLWADEIIVADSNSNDGTIEIAESLGAKVIQIPFNGYGDLRNKAISYCTKDWILSIDSDERCTEEFRDEVLSVISTSSTDIFKVPRKNFFMGKWIKYSGWYPNYRQPQLFRSGKMSYEDKPVHEGYVSHSKKKIGFIKNNIWQIPFKNFEELNYKSNRYSTLGAKKLKDRNIKGGIGKSLIHAAWAFLKHYIFKLGFLDGAAGLVIAFGNFEGTFYRYLKLTEKEKNWKIPETRPIYRQSKK
jgi:glycosyltransferase involved in cell wall biosynthesis